jgi:hypothetical protein
LQSLLRIDVTTPLVCESFEKQVAGGKLWGGGWRCELKFVDHHYDAQVKQIRNVVWNNLKCTQILDDDNKDSSN